MSGDPEQEYFSDGISEDITTDLSKVSALGVVARNTAFTFKGQSVNVREVARKLGVSHVLEGSVRKAGGRVRINAQLIDGDNRRACLGRALRPRPRRHFRDPGRDFEGDRRARSSSSCCPRKRKRSSSAARPMPRPTTSICSRGNIGSPAIRAIRAARSASCASAAGRSRSTLIMRRPGRCSRSPSRACATASAAGRRRLCGRAHRAGDRPDIAEAHCRWSERLEEQAADDAARPRSKRRLRLGPNSWEVNKEAGRFFIYRGRRRRRARAFREGRGADGKRLSCLGACCDLLPWARRREEAARTQAAMMVLRSRRAGLAAGPEQRRRARLLAAAMRSLGDEDRAREWIDRALLIDPDNLNMRYNFACVCRVRSRMRKARSRCSNDSLAGRRAPGPDRGHRPGPRPDPRRPAFPEDDRGREEAAWHRGCGIGIAARASRGIAPRLPARPTAARGRWSFPSRAACGRPPRP